MCLEPNKENWILIKNWGEEVASDYWNLISPYTISEENVSLAIENYLHYNASHFAIDLIALNSSQAISEQIINSLEAFVDLSQKMQEDVFPNLSYHVIILFQILEKVDEQNFIEKIAWLEWAYLSILLNNDHKPTKLYFELSRNPDFFCSILSKVFKSQNDSSEEITQLDSGIASHGYRLLEEWDTLPGISLDRQDLDETSLATWINEALDKLISIDRERIGALYIGKILSFSPVGTDEIWPHEAVRNIIEEHANTEIEKGLSIAIYNNRGVVTKTIAEGGKQESNLAARFNTSANELAPLWPRTASVLRSVAATYKAEAQNEDIRAEHEEDFS